ncbi:MAG: hypothetical protein KBS81_10280 [Spirochaetales bacterium]|nr:hypothetical protein [Candidatus Physcosoma equi]
MEEIKIDFSNFKPTPEEMAYYDLLIEKSKKDGVQIGFSWNKKVYNYLFESGIEGIDLSQIFGQNLTEFYLNEEDNEE